MANIHPLAVVSDKAELGHDVSVGPFSIVEADVSIDEGCTISSHAVIKSGTQLGKNNRVYEGAILGGLPQHISPPEDSGKLIVGDGNIFREHVTVHCGLSAGHNTCIGNKNFLMIGVHVAHDCRLANNIIIANQTALSGHVTIEDRAFLSGLVGIHQFCRIGQLAMLGGMARITRDVPPFLMIDGGRDHVVGLNKVGLKRAGYSVEQIAILKSAYRLMYRSGLPWNSILERLKAEFTTGPAACYYPFLIEGKRGFVQERRNPAGPHVKLPDEQKNAAEGSVDQNLRKAG